MTIAISACGKNRRSGLTEPLITEWILLYREKTGEWPEAVDDYGQTVWVKNEKAGDGETPWIPLEGESWRSISATIRIRGRGLDDIDPEIKSLSHLVSKVQKKYKPGRPPSVRGNTAENGNNPRAPA